MLIWICDLDNCKINKYLISNTVEFWILLSLLSRGFDILQSQQLMYYSGYNDTNRTKFEFWKDNCVFLMDLGNEREPKRFSSFFWSRIYWWCLVGFRQYDNCWVRFDLIPSSQFLYNNFIYLQEQKLICWAKCCKYRILRNKNKIICYWREMLFIEGGVHYAMLHHNHGFFDWVCDVFE